jgi:hypothetical protein
MRERRDATMPFSFGATHFLVYNLCNLCNLYNLYKLRKPYKPYKLYEPWNLIDMLCPIHAYAPIKRANSFDRLLCRTSQHCGKLQQLFSSFLAGTTHTPFHRGHSHGNSQSGTKRIRGRVTAPSTFSYFPCARAHRTESLSRANVYVRRMHALTYAYMLARTRANAWPCVCAIAGRAGERLGAERGLEGGRARQREWPIG